MGLRTDLLRAIPSITTPALAPRGVRGATTGAGSGDCVHAGAGLVTDTCGSAACAGTTTEGTNMVTIWYNDEDGLLRRRRFATRDAAEAWARRVGVTGYQVTPEGVT